MFVTSKWPKDDKFTDVGTSDEQEQEQQNTGSEAVSYFISCIGNLWTEVL